MKIRLVTKKAFFVLEPIYIISYLSILLYASVYSTFTTFSNRLFISSSMIDLPYQYYLYGPAEIFGRILIITLLISIIVYIYYPIKYLIKNFLSKFCSKINVSTCILIFRTLFFFIGIVIILFSPINNPMIGFVEELNFNNYIGYICIIIVLWDAFKKDIFNEMHKLPKYYISIFVLLVSAVILIEVISLSTSLGTYYADEIQNDPADITIYFNDNQNITEARYKLIMHHDNNFYLLNRSENIPKFNSVFIIPDSQVKMAILN